MKKDKNDMPIGKLVRVMDFFPPPDKLIVPDENLKITISLSRASIDFFKHEAKVHHLKYQKLIRMILDRYTTFYQKAG